MNDVKEDEYLRQEQRENLNLLWHSLGNLMGLFSNKIISLKRLHFPALPETTELIKSK